MTMRFDIKAHEHGVIRLFCIDLPDDQIENFAHTDDHAAIAHALGVSNLDATYVEMFSIRDLAGLGLSGYLTEGLGIPETDVASDRAQLDAITGHMLIVHSAAFGGIETTLMPKAPLRWVGTYLDAQASIKFEPLPAQSAKGILANPAQKPPKSDARIGGMIATYALILMFALVGLMVWIGG